MQLNPGQLQALGWLNKAPLRVIAGPGTGKTATVAEMYLQLVTGDLDPSQVLLLTFSANAAAELQRRIDQRFRRSSSESWVSTFHSFAYRILREHSPPRVRQRRLMNGFQEKLLMRKVLSAFTPAHATGQSATEPNGLRRLFDSQMLAQDALWLISSLKQELITPEEFAKWVADVGPPGIGFDGDTTKLSDLAQIFTAYFDEQERLGLADFRDVIAETVKLLETDHDLRATLCSQFRYVIVDEYQDVDAAQVQLPEHLTRDHAGFRHLAVVGDSNQSIYSFRGTTPAFLEDNWQFGGRTVRLTENFRSYASVLQAAERLQRRFGLSALAEPEDGEAAGLTAERGQSPWPAVQIRHEVTASDEAAGVARMINQLVTPIAEGGAGYRFEDIAIVLRSVRRTGTEFADALQAAGIPHDVGVSPNFAATDMVRFGVSALQALADPTNDDHLVRVLESPFCGVPTPDARRLMAEATRRRRLERETLKDRSLRTVLNHTCYLMADEDPLRWPLPWGQVGASAGTSDDPVTLIIEPTPAPARESKADVERQETIANEIEREAEREDPERPVAMAHPFYMLLSSEAKDAVHRFCTRWGILRSVVNRIPVDALLYRVFQDLDVIGDLMLKVVDPAMDTGPVLGPLRMMIKAVTDFVEFQEPLLGRELELSEVIESLEPALREYVDELEPVGESGSVRILTVHAAKGLEFPVVFVPGMAAARFPLTPRPRTPLLNEIEAEWLANRLLQSRKATNFPETAPLPWIVNEKEFLKEEARLAYVAGTRAKDLVVYSWADRYSDDDTAQPSAFLQALAGAAGLDLKQLEATQIELTDRSELHRPPSFEEKRASVDSVEAQAFSE